jgi:L-ribulokinase
VAAAAAVMGRVDETAYRPEPARADVYDELFAEYRTLHDYFSGRQEWGGNDVLHRLRNRRNGATSG